MALVAQVVLPTHILHHGGILVLLLISVEINFELLVGHVLWEHLVGAWEVLHLVKVLHVVWVGLALSSVTDAHLSHLLELLLVHLSLHWHSPLSVFIKVSQRVEIVLLLLVRIVWSV